MEAQSGFEMLAVGGLDSESDGAASVSVDFEVSGSGGQIRGDLEVIDMGGGPRFDENGLPDSAGAAVPAPLFTHELLAIVHRVFDPNHQSAVEQAIRAGLQRVGQIEFEG